MDNEIYLKLAVLGVVLIIALLSPILSALALTGIVAWVIRDKKIGDIAVVKSLIQTVPPAIKSFFTVK